MKKELDHIFDGEKALIRAIVKAIAFQNTQKGYNAEGYIWNSLNYIYPEEFVSQIEERRIKAKKETKNINKKKGAKIMNLKIAKSEMINFIKAYKSTLPKFGLFTSLYLYAEKEENLIKMIIHDPAEVGIKIEYTLSGEVKRGGFISVTYNNFIKVLSEIKINSEYINLRFDNNDLEVNIDNTTYKFSATSADDYKFVSFSTNNMASLKQNELKKALKYTMFNSKNNFVKGDSSSNNLSGVKFELLDKEMNLIATNDYRLSFYNLHNVTGNFLQEGILTPKTVYFLKAILNKENDIYLKKVGDNIYFRTNKMKVIAKLYEDKFPNYSKVLSDNKAKSVIKFKTRELTNILKKLSAPFSAYKKSIPPLTIEIKDNVINMKIKSPDENTSNTRIKLSKKTNDCKITFDTKYVIEFLDIIDEDYIKVNVNQEDDPIIFTIPSLPEYQHIIMPIYQSENK